MADDERIARLEQALAAAHADYLNLFDVLAAERGFYEAQIDELTGDAYARWMHKRRLTPHKRTLAERLALALPFKPLVSLIVVVRDADVAHYAELLESLTAQTYAPWEAIVVDASLGRAVRDTTERFAGRDGRIRPFRRETSSGALAFGFAQARGEFVARVPPGDRLAPSALFEIALLLNAEPDTDVVYTDEDELDAGGARANPHFKPDWSPESLLSRNYVGGLALYRHSLVERIGGWREEFAFATDWDLALRAGERTARIRHVADVLYHRRPGARAAGADELEMRAIDQAVARRGEHGVATRLPHAPGTYVVRYVLPKPPPRVTIVIPTRDHGADVERCLRSVFAKSTYPDFEAIVVDNGSTDPESLATFARWTANEKRVRVLRRDEPFNFSRLNNAAVRAATGELLVFLNNDTEVRTPDWLEAMAEQALRPEIGAVGAVLLYPNEAIQHAGVVLGLGPVAGHGHKNLPHGSPGHHAMLHAVNNVSAVTAACLMVRRSAFDAAGGFDEDLAVAYNDVDLCLQLGAAGLRNVVLPHVVLYHFESKSRGADVDEASARRVAQETALMLDRWKIRERDDPFYNPNLTLAREDFSVEA